MPSDLTVRPATADDLNTLARFNEAMAEETEDKPLDPERCHVFLCGNPEMIQTCREPLEQLGFVVHSRARPGNLHFERYW